MAIHTRDLKGMMDLANDRRLAEYQTKRRIAGHRRRSTDQSADDLGEDIALICLASVAGWVSVGGALMVHDGVKNGLVVSVAGVVVFIIALAKLLKGGRNG